MPDPQPPRESLRVAVHQSNGLVRVIGRGSYRISPALKDFGVAALQDGVQNLVIDLTECIGMDSTFMGVLAGLAGRLGKAAPSPGRIALIHVSPKLKRLLSTLGIDRLVDVYLAGEVPENLAKLSGRGLTENGRDASAEASRETQMKTMLAAHEDLVQALPENLPQFKDVIDFLRQDVRRNAAEGNDPTSTPR